MLPRLLARSWPGLLLEVPSSSSLLKGVYNPKAFIPHAALLRQAFAHCARFPTAASRRSLGRVSVPVWLIVLSDQLPVVALVSRYLTNKLIGRETLPKRKDISSPGHATWRRDPVLVRVSPGCPGLRGRFLTCYSPVRRSIFTGVATGWISLDLHVLSTPPAFVLSQDQTLRQDRDPPPRTAGRTIGEPTAGARGPDGRPASEHCPMQCMNGRGTSSGGTPLLGTRSPALACPLFRFQGAPSPDTMRRDLPAGHAPRRGGGAFLPRRCTPAGPDRQETEPSHRTVSEAADQSNDGQR